MIIFDKFAKLRNENNLFNWMCINTYVLIHMYRTVFELNLLPKSGTHSDT